MFCKECGYKLDENCKFCPNCGTQVVKVEEQGASVQEQVAEEKKPVDDQVELDKLIDEIFFKAPFYKVENAGELSRAMGIPFREALKIMQKKWKEFKKDRKEGKYPDTDYCPYCGTQNFGPYVYKSYTRTTKVDFFGERYITETVPESVSATDFQCNVCGNIWRPKSKKR